MLVTLKIIIEKFINLGWWTWYFWWHFPSPDWLDRAEP